MDDKCGSFEAEDLVWCLMFFSVTLIVIIVCYCDYCRRENIIHEIIVSTFIYYSAAADLKPRGLLASKRGQNTCLQYKAGCCLSSS